MKLEMVCIQLCQGAVSAWCTDKPCKVGSVPDHMVVVAFQKLAAFIPVVVQKPRLDDLETMMYSFHGNERAICELRMIGYVGLHS